MLTFESVDVVDGITELCALVPIIDDTLGNEPLEGFSVRITNFSPAGSGRVGSSPETCVIIVDDDGMYISDVIKWTLFY